VWAGIQYPRMALATRENNYTIESRANGEINLSATSATAATETSTNLI